MARSPVVAALIRKREDLANDIAECQKRLRRLGLDYQNVESTLKLFAPDLPLPRIRVRQLRGEDRAPRGHLAAILLNALREAPEGLDTAALAEAVLTHRGVEARDKATVKAAKEAVRYCLRKQRARGLVRAWPGPDKLLVWEIAG